MTAAKLRRYQNNLVIIGTGVIAFGIWSVIRIIITSILTREQIGLSIAQSFSTEFFDNPITLAKQIYYVLLGYLLMIGLGTRFFVGMSARAEGNGNIQGMAYLVVAIVLIIINLLSVMYTISTIKDDVADFVSEVLADISEDDASDADLPADTKSQADLAALLSEEASTDVSNLEGAIEDRLVSILVDLTSLLTLIEMVVASFHVKKLTRMLME